MTGGDSRREGFDLLRAAAIFGVVWIHGCDTSPWAVRAAAYAAPAVPLFILVSFFLLQRSALRHPERGGWAAWRQRLGRLLPPYLFWSAAYWGVRWAKHAAVPGLPPLEFAAGPVLFLGAASYQLYFIAALIYWSALFFPPGRYFARRASRQAAGVALLGAGGLALLGAGSWLAPRLELAPAQSLFVHALGLTGYAPLGMAVALGHDRWPLSAPRRRACAAAAAAAAAGLYVFSPPGTGRTPLALALFLWAVYYDGAPMPAWIRRISAVSFGIFFVHGFFVEGLQTLASRMGWPLDAAFGAGAVVALAFGASWATGELLYRVPKLRWLVS